MNMNINGRNFDFDQIKGKLHRYFYRGDEIPADIKPVIMDVLGFDETTGKLYSLCNFEDDIDFDEFKNPLQFNELWRTNLIFRIYFNICKMVSAIDKECVSPTYNTIYNFDSFAKYAFYVNLLYNKVEPFKDYIDFANLVIKDLMDVPSSDKSNFLLVKYNKNNDTINYEKVINCAEKYHKGIYGFYLKYGKKYFSTHRITDKKAEAYIDFFMAINQLEEILG